MVRAAFDARRRVAEHRRRRSAACPRTRRHGRLEHAADRPCRACEHAVRLIRFRPLMSTIVGIITMSLTPTKPAHVAARERRHHDLRNPERQRPASPPCRPSSLRHRPSRRWRRASPGRACAARGAWRHGSRRDRTRRDPRPDQRRRASSRRPLPLPAAR